MEKILLLSKYKSYFMLYEKRSFTTCEEVR